MIAAGHVRRLQARGAEARARAGAGRRPRDHGGGARRARRRAHQSGRRRAAAGRALRPARAAPCDRDVRDATVEQFATRYRIDREHAARVAAMAVALYRAARPDADPARGPAPRMGGAAARDRLLGLAHRLSQARRVHPAERRHAGVLRAASSGRCRWLVLGCRGGLAKVAPVLGRPAVPRAAPRAAPRRAVPPRAPADRRCRASASASRARIRFGMSARWLKAHPLTAHLLEKEQREWAGWVRWLGIDRPRCGRSGQGAPCAGFVTPQPAFGYKDAAGDRSPWPAHARIRREALQSRRTHRKEIDLGRCGAVILHVSADRSGCCWIGTEPEGFDKAQRLHRRAEEDPRQDGPLGVGGSDEVRPDDDRSTTPGPTGRDWTATTPRPSGSTSRPRRRRAGTTRPRRASAGGRRRPRARAHRASRPRPARPPPTRPARARRRS